MRGGIARVRPDGTCLEQVTWGSRNIYDIAIDPYLNIFARDNTNDGRGWDTRFHHMIPDRQQRLSHAVRQLRRRNQPTTL